LLWNRLSGGRADGRLFGLVINLYCQHTRCFAQRRCGRGYSPRARHAFDGQHGAVHVVRESSISAN
jgi:hypothetical protein